jgi:hypothetical protein
VIPTERSETLAMWWRDGDRSPPAVPVTPSYALRLVDAGETRLFGSTQDDRLAALAIYFSLGYVPVFRPEKLDRWRRVCNALGVPFSVAEWGWPEGTS